MYPVIFAGKTYWHFENLRNTPEDKQIFRSKHKRCAFGDPAPTGYYSTSKKAREDNEIGGYVEDITEAYNECYDLGERWMGMVK